MGPSWDKKVYEEFFGNAVMLLTICCRGGRKGRKNEFEESHWRGRSKDQSKAWILLV